MKRRICLLMLELAGILMYSDMFLNDGLPIIFERKELPFTLTSVGEIIFKNRTFLIAL